MAKQTKQAQTKTAPAANGALVTGLGETMEQIEDLAADLAKTLMVTVKRGKADEILEAAYKFGLAEKRRRKLARKVGRGAGAADEE